MKLNTERNSIVLALHLQNAFGIRTACGVIGHEPFALLFRSVSLTHLAKIVKSDKLLGPSVSWPGQLGMKPKTADTESREAD